MRRGPVRTARRWLYIGHRWLGIVTCLFFAMWFISGVVMMYVAFPGLSDKERLAALPEIVWQRVALSPDDAMKAANATRYPRDLRLTMLAEEPVYRFIDWDGKRQVISAVDGRPITQVSEQTALAVAKHHPASKSPELEEVVDRDQWSVTARYNPARPLYLVALADDAGTKLYVSSRSGEIVLDTDRAERFWNWLGSIPHWIYPTVLRKDGPLWRLVVLWISGICLIVGMTGIWVGILRVRLRRRYASGHITPYRDWMAWHHVTGLIAGIFVLTWMFSGWLSLNPGDYFASRNTPREVLQRYAGHDAPTIAAKLPAPQRASVEARFVWLDGTPTTILASRDGTLTPTDVTSGDVAPLPQDRLWTAATKLLPQASLVNRSIVEQYDAYWYAHHQHRELPVLRAMFDDDAQTWFHISPVTGEIVGRTDSSRRTYRWLFNALHSFDFQLLLMHRPAWDIVVLLLSVVGTIVSVSGIVIGWRYLRRRTRYRAAN
ncbi:PepSY domain-containing protein [Bradyrhizobium sp. LHD-71]|uniref:PepSY domain-containing protein n=1 Tax=Bradyrhizobium sp. LHD-71 TaxID=3072141 RepID=UPI00280FCBBF|nr:PepSY domain-containing protein [Bradyrhizobium sp. LHD-71]MDQ8731060.1 PepSY domain-containing protein [Bradyrhizobium sp. LHD-71]